MTSPERKIKGIIDNLKVENNYKRVYDNLSALISALRDDEEKEVKEAAVAIARAGGISVVIDHMQQNPHFGGTQGLGCVVLRALAAASENYKKDICDKGGVFRATAALKQFGDIGTLFVPKRSCCLVACPMLLRPPQSSHRSL